MKIVLAADHRGMKLKDQLKEHLTANGHIVEDMGAHTEDPNDDYPDFGYPAAQAVASSPGSRGILVCGSGMGMDIVANKVKGIRATVAYSKDGAVHGASHDGVNVITLASDVIGFDEAKEIVDAFLTTPLVREEKYVRRIQKIAIIEDQHFR
jgi:RpiB/LacA/LacB family sugar-phosphate isomerase